MVKGTNEIEHDINLFALLHSARLNGIKFNSMKMQFRQQEVKFCGHAITPEGMEVNEEAVEAVKKMSSPQDRSTLQSFLGMVHCMKRFSKELTKLAHTVRELVKQNTIFRWEEEHERAFQAIKSEISKTRNPCILKSKQETCHSD